MSGSNVPQILCGMHEFEQQIMLYAGFSLSFVMDCYNNEKNSKNNEKRVLSKNHT